VQLHYIAALWGANDANANIGALGNIGARAETADVAWVLEVINNFV
jgi:hypothetical protein